MNVGVADFPSAFAFYDAVLAELGLVRKFGGTQDEAAGWIAPGAPRPVFVVCTPLDERPASAGNGSMVALLAPDRAAVDAAHARALSLGGTCEGRPGLRPEYHADFYGAYFRDPDGNKLCVCCHDPAA